MKWGYYKFFCILVLLSFEMLALAFQKKDKFEICRTGSERYLSAFYNNNKKIWWFIA